MPSSARRSAKSRVTMLTAAFEMQTPRIVEDVGGDRRDVDDLRREAQLPAQTAHKVGHALREEEGALEVDAEHAVHALLGGFQDIHAHLGRYAGAVDQHVDAAEGFQGCAVIRSGWPAGLETSAWT